MDLTGNEVLSISTVYFEELVNNFKNAKQQSVFNSLESAIFLKDQIQFCQTPEDTVGVCFVPLSKTPDISLFQNGINNLLVCASVDGNGNPLPSNGGVYPFSVCPPTNCNIIQINEETGVNDIPFDDITNHKLVDSPFEGIYFSNHVINTIFNQKNCVGISVMIVQSPDGSFRLAICGVGGTSEEPKKYFRQIESEYLIANSDIIIDIR